MKFFLLLPLFHVVFAYEPILNKDSASKFQAPLEFSDDNDIVSKWKSTEKAFQNILLSAAKSMIPASFKIASTANISSTCIKSLVGVMRGLTQNQIWAIKMLDSAGKMPNLFGGSPSAIGDYDTCIELKHPTQMFKGMYCPVYISYPLPKRREYIPVEQGIPELNNVMEPGSLSEEIAKQAQFLYTFQMRLSVCLPSTCSENEVSKIAEKILQLKGLKLTVNVPFCESEDDILEYTSGEILIIMLFITLISVVVFATFTDVILLMKTEDGNSSQKGFGLKVILCFSAYTNFTKLLKIDTNPESLTIFHGLRVFTMFWIILGHSAFVVNYSAYDGFEHAKKLRKNFWFTPVINAYFTVDVFFFMSAVLLSYLCMKRKEKVNASSIFLLRYWRLTPSLMWVTALYSIAGHFGSGPLWRETFINTICKNCKERGWWNFFYVNDFLFSSKICMGYSWYLSADTHLFLISLFAVTILKKNTRKGIFFIGLLLVVGVLLTAISHIYYDLRPYNTFSYPNYEDWYYYGSRLYTPPHIHLSVYAIGLFVGYLLAMKKIHIPRHVNIIGWILSIVTMLILIYCVYPWNQGHISSLAVVTIHGATKTVLWTLCLAFITISCTGGYGGIVHRILSWGAFHALGRLTFMAYLIHYGIIYMYVASTRSTMSYSLRNLIFFSICYTTTAYLVACVLSLLLESPFFALLKLLMDKKEVMKSINGMERKCSKDCV